MICRAAERDEADLVAWVKAATKELRGAVSGRASDLEVKSGAKMHVDGIGGAELVINMWGGPCTEKNGCDETPDGLLSGDDMGLSGLRHPQGEGAWWKWR
ncbi:DddA-like double-stranded DNA deaminase toxin [Kitasatospora sp. NPDC056783]|uniref:DddA-like double-stranded DNA deaminase toxin n=1 Tax=Kitasatospora sp. NPDC056783 TaxID=3345943 RepID=UPI0036C32705